MYVTGYKHLKLVSGVFLFPTNTKSKTGGTLCIHSSLQCAKQFEVSYYGSDVGRANKCNHSEGNNVVVSQELKQRFKTVLPMCKPCLYNKKEPFTERPYGKVQKWFFCFVNINI